MEEIQSSPTRNRRPEARASQAPSYLPPGMTVNEALDRGIRAERSARDRPGAPATGRDRSQRGRAPSRALVRLALLFYGVLLAAAFAWAALDGRSLRGPPPPPHSAAARRCASTRRRAAGGGHRRAALAPAHAAHAPRRAARAQRCAAALGPLSLAECWLLALVSGVAEEAFFRGALQPQVGLLAASLLFGAAHFVPAPRAAAVDGLRRSRRVCCSAGSSTRPGTCWRRSSPTPAINGVNLRQLTRRANSIRVRRASARA